MVDPRNVGSILTDFVKTAPNGQTYTFTLDPKAVDANHILLKEDPNQPSSGRLVPSLTPEQEKDAKDKVQSRLRTMLDYKVTPEQKFAPPAPYRPTDGDYARADAKQMQDDIVTMLGKFYSGSSTEVTAAANYFKGFDKGIDGINKVGDELIITYNDDRKPYKLAFKANGERIGLKDWISGATVLSKMPNVTKAIQRAGLDGNEQFSSSEGGYSQQSSIPTFTEAMVFVLGGDGKTTVPKSLNQYFDDTFKRGTNWTVFSETETAKNAAAVATTMLQTLPPSATKAMSVSSEEVGGVTNVRISLPSVMKGVVRIPMKKGANLESEIKRIIKNIYDLAASAKSGEPFTSSDALIDNGKEDSTTKKPEYKTL
jgi:hypothetical protein